MSRFFEGLKPCYCDTNAALYLSDTFVALEKMLPESIDTYGGRAFIAVPEFERFFRNVVLEKQFPNHAAVIFGHYGKELVSILKQLGVEDIEYNHLKDVPYKGENIFHSNEEWF